MRDFSIPSETTGPDKLIPPTILTNCKGLAVLTVVRAGFLITARTGTGVVVARNDSGGWSAPSAIGIGGIGGGFMLGGDVTDFIIVLNTKRAVTAFSKGGNVTLGGNMTVAAGPKGRNVEADIAVRSAAPIYTYSKTRGLFIGISLEGTIIVERKGANAKLYGRQVRSRELLGGTVDVPYEASDL